MLKLQILIIFGIVSIHQFIIPNVIEACFDNDKEVKDLTFVLMLIFL